MVITSKDGCCLLANLLLSDSSKYDISLSHHCISYRVRKYCKSVLVGLIVSKTEIYVTLSSVAYICYVYYK